MPAASNGKAIRVLAVSQYFPPEPGATQNRMQTFVDGLVARGHHVTVLCEQPNHPSGVFHPGFGRRPVLTERRNGRAVHRLWVAASPKKSTSRRLLFYATFAGGAGLAAAALPRHDVMFATSPPLPGALATGLAARLRDTPFVLDVRDLWPAAAQALGELSGPRAVAALERAERWLYRTARCVTATTRPFCRHIDEVAGRPVSVHLPNGALDELVSGECRAAPSNGVFTVGYAGNLGIAQGLRIVLDAADELRGEDVRFVVVGDGPESDELRAERARRGLDSVEFRPGMPVSDIGSFLQSCNALLVPLRAHPLLHDFIPSKLYDAMAVGRPALVAAPGEASALARELKCGVEVQPEDGEDLARAIRRLRADPELVRQLGESGRAAAGGLARSHQVERLEQALSEAAAGRTNGAGPRS